MMGEIEGQGEHSKKLFKEISADIKELLKQISPSKEQSMDLEGIDGKYQKIVSNFINSIIVAKGKDGKIDFAIKIKKALKKEKELNPSPVDKKHYENIIKEVDNLIKQIKAVELGSENAESQLEQQFANLNRVQKEADEFFKAKGHAVGELRTLVEKLNKKVENLKGFDKKYHQEYLEAVKGIKKRVDSSSHTNKTGMLLSVSAELQKLNEFYVEKVKAGQVVRDRIKDLEGKIKKAEGADKKYYQNALSFVKDLEKKIDSYKDPRDISKLRFFKKELDAYSSEYQKHVVAKAATKGQTAGLVLGLKAMKGEAKEGATKKYLAKAIKQEERDLKKFKGAHPNAQNWEEELRKTDTRMKDLREKVREKAELIKEVEKEIAEFIEPRDHLKSTSGKDRLLKALKPKSEFEKFDFKHLRKLEDLLKNVKAAKPGEVSSLRQELTQLHWLADPTSLVKAGVRPSGYVGHLKKK